jgi:hypothetical protein
VQVWSNGDFIIHNLERIQKYNWQESAYEYGLHDHWSITANAIIQHFRGLFISSYQKRETGDNGIDEVNIAEGAEIDEFFHAVTLGAKHQLFRHDHDILSVHWRGQLWDRKMQNQLWEEFWPPI